MRLSRDIYFPYRETPETPVSVFRAERKPIRNVGYIRDRVRVVSPKRSLVRKRGLEARKRFTVASARGASGLSGLFSGILFYANRLSFFLVSRRALSRHAAAEERSQLLRHALPSLPYLRCNLFPGINAPGEIFPGCLSRISLPNEKRIVRSYRRELSSELLG